MTEEPPVSPRMWGVVIEVADAAALDIFEAAFADHAVSLASFEDEASGLWRITAYLESVPDEADIAAKIAIAARDAGIGAPVFRIAELPPTDWVAEVEKSLQPIHVGAYYVFGSHVTDAPPPGSVPLRVEAGLAFGTGSHETTRGCLTAFEWLYPNAGPRNPLDVGTGSGILALALAKKYGVAVLGGDIDPIAVDVARENAEINGVADKARFVACTGLDHPDIAAGAPYDLIVANIVANPLIELAPAIEVAAIYGGQGLFLRDEIPIGNWRTLILSRL